MRVLEYGHSVPEGYESSKFIHARIPTEPAKPDVPILDQMKENNEECAISAKHICINKGEYHMPFLLLEANYKSDFVLSGENRLYCGK